MEHYFSITISIVALFISCITVWLTLFRRGTIKMTRPTLLYFGPDGGMGPPKVFLRTLLYSTAKRGQIVEDMYIKLTRRETSQNFNIWVYGQDTLSRGSGLFVGENGVSENHHFLLPKDGSDFEFLSGKYQINVYVSLVNRPKQILLGKFFVTLTKEQSDELSKKNTGVFFDWGPDLGDYQAHTDSPPKIKNNIE